jgi:predicted nucleic acid-binding protein
MGMKVAIDTNVFLAVKNKEENAESCKKILDCIEAGTLSGAVSAIVPAEVLVGFYQNGEITEAGEFVKKITQSYEIIIVDIEIAQESARIRGEIGAKLPDAIVIASAKKSNCDVLVTSDDLLIKKAKKAQQPSQTPEEFAEKCPLSS